MLGFELDFWDYLTFAVLAVAGLAVLVIALLVAGIPGRIAIARKHPDAEAVRLLGYAGFLPVVPWIQAFMWAFKPTDIVDIRRFPPAEAKAIDEQIADLKAAIERSAPAKTSPENEAQEAPRTEAIPASGVAVPASGESR